MHDGCEPPPPSSVIFRASLPMHKPLTSSFRLAGARLWGEFGGPCSPAAYADYAGRQRMSSVSCCNFRASRSAGTTSCIGMHRACLCTCPTQRASTAARLQRRQKGVVVGQVGCCIGGRMVTPTGQDVVADPAGHRPGRHECWVPSRPPMNREKPLTAVTPELRLLIEADRVGYLGLPGRTGAPRPAGRRCAGRDRAVRTAAAAQPPGRARW